MSLLGVKVIIDIIRYFTGTYDVFVINQQSHICLVNAIAGKTIVPEKLMYCDDYKWLASQSIELLLNEEKREACIDGLKEVTSLIDLMAHLQKRQMKHWV